MTGHNQTPEVNSVSVCEEGGHKLVQAVLLSAHKELEELLAKGADPNRPDLEGRIALVEAAARGKGDLADTLLENGADPRVAYGKEGNPLAFAAQAGHVGIIRSLFRYLDPKDLTCAEQSTALRWAARGGHLDALDALLSRGLDPNAPSQGGVTPLMAAAAQGEVAAIRLLLSRGADANATDARGLTAATYASIISGRDVLDALSDCRTGRKFLKRRLKKFARRTLLSALAKGLAKPALLRRLPPGWGGYWNLAYPLSRPFINKSRGMPLESFIFSPTQIPAGSAYYILHDDSRLENSRRILELFSDARFLGFVDARQTGSVSSEAYVVIASQRWPERLDELQRCGLSPKQVLVFMPPLSNPWDYWQVATHDLVGMERTADGKVLMSEAGIERHISLMGQGIRADDCLLILKYVFPGAHRGTIRRNIGKIKEVSRNLSDDRSKELYLLLMSADPLSLIERFFSGVLSRSHYFDYVTIPEGGVIINGGINEGSELPRMIVSVGRRGHIYCFDPMGFEFLDVLVRETVNHFGDQISLLSEALWNSPGSLSLPVGAGNQAIGGCAGRELPLFPLRRFPCTSIDAFVKENGLSAVDYIKLDLEGGEPQALAGAKETLKEFRPQLAVSIYHEIEHMWDIPLFLMDVLSDYDFFVEHYSYLREETLLYCLPRKQESGTG